MSLTQPFGYIISLHNLVSFLTIEWSFGVTIRAQWSFVESTIVTKNKTHWDTHGVRHRTNSLHDNEFFVFSFSWIDCTHIHEYFHGENKPLSTILPWDQWDNCLVVVLPFQYYILMPFLLSLGFPSSYILIYRMLLRCIVKWVPRMNFFTGSIHCVLPIVLGVLEILHNCIVFILLCLFSPPYNIT